MLSINHFINIIKHYNEKIDDVLPFIIFHQQAKLSKYRKAFTVPTQSSNTSL